MLAKGHNPYFWTKSRLKRSSYRENKNKFQDLVRTHGNRNYWKIDVLLKEKSSELIEKDLTFLLTENSKNPYVLTTPEDTKKPYVFTHPESESKKPKTLRSYPLNSVAKRTSRNLHTLSEQTQKKGTQKQAICPITNLNINMQKKSSKFLCTNGIKYYKKYHPEIYTELEKRLSERWQNEPEEKRIEQIHHSVRNEFHNEIFNGRLWIGKMLDKEKTEPTIFNTRDLIEPRRLLISGL